MASSIAPPPWPPLTLIYQASYEQVQIPDDWKRAFVTSLFKKGAKSKASVCRPVSLTSCCCKVIEHIVHSHIMKFLQNNKILNDYQHVFRKKRSCETHLITTVHDPAIGQDRRQQVDAILLDFSKAFDKLPHHRLAVKLHHYGIRNKNLSWIQSFLADRNQQVVLDRKTSSHSEFHKVQCLDLSCSWYTPMTCSQEFPLQWWLSTVQSHTRPTGCRVTTYRSYRNGKENGKWFLTQTSANVFGSPTNERTYRLLTTLMPST